MTFGDVLNALRRFWTVVVAFTIAALVIAGAAATLPETKYEARATLLAQPDTDRVDFAAVEAVRFLLPSLAELVSTNTFRGQVGERFDPPLPANAVDTQADFEPGTGIVHVTGTDANPARAQAITQVASRLLGQQQLSDAVVITVLDPPERPTGPAGPGTRAYLVGGLVLGLLGGALLAIMLGAAARSREFALAAPDQAGGARQEPPAQTAAAAKQPGPDPEPQPHPQRGPEPKPPAPPAWMSAEQEAGPEPVAAASAAPSEPVVSAQPAAAVASAAPTFSPAALLQARLDELQLPVLGAIPVKASPARTAQNGAHGFDDAFRALAGRLTTLALTQQQLFFTSARTGAGRTTVVANTVWALATAGVPVVAVDADVDNPMLHRFLRVPSEPGLTDLARVAIGEAAHASSVPALSVIPVGGAVEASDAVLEDAVRRLLELTGQRCVLLDCPPLVESARTATLARGIRGGVLVLDAADPRACEDAARCAGTAAELGVELVGVVLNRASQ